jgi:hypothetical protein
VYLVPQECEAHQALRQGLQDRCLWIVRRVDLAMIGLLIIEIEGDLVKAVERYSVASQGSWPFRSHLFRLEVQDMHL